MAKKKTLVFMGEEFEVDAETGGEFEWNGNTYSVEKGALGWSIGVEMAHNEQYYCGSGKQLRSAVKDLETSLLTSLREFAEALGYELHE